MRSGSSAAAASRAAASSRFSSEAIRTARSAAFAGWFGPIGAAALFYAMMIQDETGSAALWPPISLAIGASVLAHGVSSTPLTRLFGRGRHEHPSDGLATADLTDARS